MIDRVEKVIKKIVIYSLSGLFVIFCILFLWYTFFWTPDAKKARNLIRSTSGYYPPISTKLLYSKNYWESLDVKEPRSMCFVFQYSQKDLIALQNYDFSNNNRKNQYLSSPIPVDKGCAKFRDSLKSEYLALFKKSFADFQRLEGAIIFINERNRIVMFEIYLFD